MEFLLDLREVFVQVHVVLDIHLAGPVLFWSVTFSGEVPGFVTVVTFLYAGCLVLLGVLLKLGGIPSALVGVLPWPPSIWWRVSPRQVHWYWYIVHVLWGIQGVVLGWSRVGVALEGLVEGCWVHAVLDCSQ